MPEMPQCDIINPIETIIQYLIWCVIDTLETRSFLTPGFVGRDKPPIHLREHLVLGTTLAGVLIYVTRNVTGLCVSLGK